MKNHLLTFLAVLAALLTASALYAAGKKAPAQTTAVATEAASERVWIVRPDGEQSCGFKAGQSVEEVAAELKKTGITVFESRKGNDGMMHIQMCGASTGSLNAYLIPKGELEKAKTLGFKEAPQGFKN